MLYADIEAVPEDQVRPALESLPDAVIADARILDSDIVSRVEVASAANVARDEDREVPAGVSGVSLVFQPAPAVARATTAVASMFSKCDGPSCGELADGPITSPGEFGVGE